MHRSVSRRRQTFISSFPEVPEFAVSINSSACLIPLLECQHFERSILFYATDVSRFQDQRYARPVLVPGTGTGERKSVVIFSKLCYKSQTSSSRIGSAPKNKETLGSGPKKLFPHIPIQDTFTCIRLSRNAIQSRLFPMGLRYVKKKIELWFYFCIHSFE